MPALRTPWASQPQQAWPAVPGLLGAWLPAAPNSIGNAGLAKTGAGQLAPMPGGVAFLPGGASYFSGRIPSIGTYPVVLGVVALPNAADSDWAGIGGATGIFNYIKIGQISSGGAKVAVSLRPQDSGALNQLIISAEPATTGRLVTAIVVLKSATVADVFVNGKKYAAGATAALTPMNQIAVGASVTNGVVSGAGSGGGILAQFYGNANFDDGYWLSVSAVPWRIFMPLRRHIAYGSAIAVYRPGTDILVSGWLGNPNNASKFANIDESTRSDASTVMSPPLGNEAGPFTFAWRSPVPAGDFDIRIAAEFLLQYSGQSGQVRVVFLDAASAVVATGAWQTLTGAFADYTDTVTLSGTATQGRLEVQLL